MLHFKESKNKSALTTRWAQMTKQEQIIEKKKMEIQSKLEAQKQAAALAAHAKLSNQVVKDDKSTGNIFSNDGSFMNQYKALLEKQKLEQIEKEKQKLEQLEKEKQLKEEPKQIKEEFPQRDDEGQYDQTEDRKHMGDKKSKDKQRKWSDRSQHQPQNPTTPVTEDRKNIVDNIKPGGIPPLMQFPIKPPNDNSDSESKQWLSEINNTDEDSDTNDGQGNVNKSRSIMPGAMPTAHMVQPAVLGLIPNMGPGTIGPDSNMGPDVNINLAPNVGPMPIMGPGPNMGQGPMGIGPNMGPRLMGPGPIGPGLIRPGPMGPGPMGPGPMGPGPMGPGPMGPGPMGPGPMGPGPMMGLGPMGPGPMGPGPMGPRLRGPRPNMGQGSNPAFGSNQESDSGTNSGSGSNAGPLPGSNMGHGAKGPGHNMHPGPHMGPRSKMGPRPNMDLRHMGPGPNMGPRLNMGRGPNMGPGPMMGPRGPNMPPGGPMPPFMGGPPNFPMPPNFMGPNGPCGPGPMPPNMCPPNMSGPRPNGPMPPFFGPPFPMMGPNGPPLPPNGNMPFIPPFGPNGPQNFNNGNGPPLPFMQPNAVLPNSKATESNDNSSRETKIKPPLPPPANTSKDTKSGNKQKSNTPEVFSSDTFPPSVLRAASEVASNGDHWENVLRAIQSQDQNLWFLQNTNSKEYKQFKELVNKIRRDGDRKQEVKPEDKYEPEFSMEDEDSFDCRANVKEESRDSFRNSSHGQYYNESSDYMKRERASSQSDDESDVRRDRKRKKKSRWSDEPPSADVKPPGVVAPLPSDFSLSKIDEEGLKLTNLNRNNQALMQYALTNYGTTSLSPEDWKKCEDNFKLNLLYQDMLKKRQEVERLASLGKHKYEYDSDEDTREGTWEHKLRAKEMNATEKWADELTKQAAGKHHIGDFLPPEELKKFMEKYSALKNGKEPDLSDYKEFKLKEDNVGFKMLQKLGWTEGQGLGAEGSGIVDPINKAKQPVANLGLGASTSDAMSPEDDEFDAYRKRMMLAYRFRPNPLNNPRRPYY